MPGVLTVRLRGARAAVALACKTMGGTRLDNATAALDWSACRDHTGPWFATRSPDNLLWRLSVPATAPVLDVPGVAPPLLEWQGALRWVQAPAQAGAALQAAAQAVGGSASVFIANSPEDTWAHSPFGDKTTALAQLHQRIKHSFDPAGIFNPGRVSAHW